MKLTVNGGEHSNSHDPRDLLSSPPLLSLFLLASPCSFTVSGSANQLTDQVINNCYCMAMNEQFKVSVSLRCSTKDRDVRGDLAQLVSLN